MMTSNDRVAFPFRPASRHFGCGKQTANVRPLRQRLGKYVSRWVLLAASLACAAFPTYAANPELISVANHTGFSDEELGKYLAENLNQNLKDEIAKRNLAVFALTATFPGKRACFAAVGLTEAAPANRHARHPDFVYESFAVQTEKSWDAKTECGSERLVASLTRMNSAPIEQSLTGIENTHSDGGTRLVEHFNAKTVTLAAFGIDYKKELFAEIHEHNFSAAFDYRHIQTSVYAAGVQFKDGDYMCVAFAGLSATAPTARRFRWPATRTGYVQLQTGGSLEGCKGIVAKQAIHELLEKPWTADGLLKSFVLTREDGIPLPDVTKVAKARARAKAKVDTANQPKSVQVASKIASINRTYCENICRNGDCIRSFPDGRKERWQAPRTYNAMNSNWEWDTSTNACGA